MSKDTILSILPYVLIYILIFKDPYSALIPSKESKLEINANTTWLLDESNEKEGLALAYNKKYHKEIFNKKNAFTYFLPALNGPELTQETKNVFNKFKTTEIDLTFIPLNKMRASLFEPTNSSDKETNSKSAPALLNTINIPSDVTYYKEPILSSEKDTNKTNNRIIQYIYFLSISCHDEASVKKALGQLRLLSNTGNDTTWKSILKFYTQIIYKANYSKEKLIKIETDLPPWPNVREHILIQHRVRMTMSIIYQHADYKALLKLMRENNKDLIMNRNALLVYMNEFYLGLSKVLPDKPIDQISKKDLENIKKSNLNIFKDTRVPLAETMLFSKSSKENNDIVGNVIGKIICKSQISVMTKAIQDIKDAQNQKTTKDNKNE